MLLCLDVGNTHIYGGVVASGHDLSLQQADIKLRFRYPSKQQYTSDQLGIFLRSVLRENHLSPADIDGIAMASVVPSLDYSLRGACKKYFDQEPFVLQAGVKTGLKIATQNPSEVGADLVASAIAATHRYPGQPLIIVDFGTATSFVAINSRATFLGSVFLPGLQTAMNSLQQAASKLPAVEIIKPQQVLGRNTMQSIQSGLYHMQLATLKHLLASIKQECFASENKPCVVMGTGGFAKLFASSDCFDAIYPDLVLEGIYCAYCRNKIAAC